MTATNTNAQQFETIKHHEVKLGSFAKCLACAPNYAQRSGQSWFIVGDSGYVVTEKKRDQWAQYDHLEVTPDGEWVVHKSEINKPVTAMAIGDTWGKYTVVGTKEIKHGKFFTNTDIIQIVALKGKRNAKAVAHITKSGKLSITSRGNYGWFEGAQVLDGTK